MRVALYARYSSERQNERSIEDQLAVGRRHAQSRGWDVVATFADAAISGAAMANRPGLQACLASAQTGAFDLLLVEDEDRLARNLEHQAHIFNRLKHAGVGIATLASDRIGVLEVGLKGVMAELYLVNLSQKTSRGMRANAEQGLATGARIYGYRSSPGGAMVIVPAEALVIREIFDRFVVGETAREIAADLNARHVPATFGGAWNASAVNGNRKRGCGILYQSLYAGVKTWNRLEVIKDPETGRRRPRVKPRDEWRTTPAEALRIVPQSLWEAAQARKAAEGASRPTDLAARRKGLFSGLLKCGQCGASYTAYRRGTLICTGHHERGSTVCANARPVRRRDVELRALDGLASRLLAPEAVAAYVTAYRAAWAEEVASRQRHRAPVERRIAELSRRCRRIAEATADGRASRSDRELLFEHEAEHDRLEAQLAQWDSEAGADPPITLHPAAAGRYAQIVAELQAWLQTAVADAEPPARAFVDAVQTLVTRIDIHPDGPGLNDPFRLQLHGDLARFMTPLEDPATAWRVSMVAGGGVGRAPPSFPWAIDLEPWAARSAA